MKKILFSGLFCLAFLALQAQVRPPITSFSIVDQIALADLMNQYITVEIIQHHCDYNQQSNDPLLDIHNDFDFLPFHRMYIEGLEDFLILSGRPDFVPLPTWNPSMGCVPQPFRFVTASCLEAECNNVTNNTCAEPTDWCPVEPLPAELNSGLCSLFMDPIAPTPGVGNCCVSGLSYKIEQPYHNNVHGDFGGVMRTFRSPSTPVFWFWHAYLDDIWKRWEENCPGSNTLPVDFYMKDNHKVMQSDRDRGEEPNIDTGVPYLSEDIWVRQNNDGFTTAVHQNPDYVPGQPAYIYVRVRNRGYQTSSSADNGSQIQLYWAKASTGLSWPGQWNGMISPGPGIPGGGQIGTQNILSIQAGDQKIYEFQWYPPDPGLYAGINSEPWHFCLLARVDAPLVDPMTFPEGSNVGTNVVNNNNLVWKNISVYNGVNGLLTNDCADTWENAGIAVAVENPESKSATFDLVLEDDEHIHCIDHNCMIMVMAHDFDTPPGKEIHRHVPVVDRGNTITEEGTVVISMDDKLYKHWLDGGKLGSGFIELKAQYFPQILKKDPTVNPFIQLIAEKRHLFQLTDKHVRFSNITLNAHELNTVSMVILLPQQEVSNKKKYVYDIKQVRTSSSDLIGGVRYDIQKPVCEKLAVNTGNDLTINKGCSVKLTNSIPLKCQSLAWINAQGNVIGETNTIEVSPAVTTTYTLRTVSKEGCTAQDQITVTVLNKPCIRKGFIDGISPNPAQVMVNVTFKVLPEATNVTYRMVRNDNSFDKTFYLDLGGQRTILDKDNYMTQKAAIDLTEFPKGSYQLMLIINGEIVDTKQLVKL